MTDTAQTHPIEHLHQARDALLEAQAAQARHAASDDAGELAAWGSAITGTLEAAHSVSSVLCAHIESLDRQQVWREAYYDDPDLALDEAGRHLEHLRCMLHKALVDAARYWEKAEQVHADLHGPAIHGLSLPDPPLEDSARPAEAMECGGTSETARTLNHVAEDSGERPDMSV